MTNDIKAGKISIMKCEKCRDGYLIAKSAGNGYFMGCTNYKSDKTGCNNTIGTNEYLTLKSIEPEFREPFVSAVRGVSEDEKRKEGIVAQVTEEKLIKEKANRDKNKCFKEEDLFVILQTVISCLDHISENYFFGVSILIAVLRGGKRKQIEKHKLNEVPEYGVYSQMSRDDMRAIVQWLINNQYMLKTKGKYPVLHPTYNGKHYEECITKKQIKDLKNYLEDPNREIFEEDDKND